MGPDDPRWPQANKWTPSVVMPSMAGPGSWTAVRRFGQVSRKAAFQERSLLPLPPADQVSTWPQSVSTNKQPAWVSTRLTFRSVE